MTVGVLTAVIAALLWKPFKRFQNSGGQGDTSSDMIGLTVPVSAEISHNGGTIRYSGINWKARLDLASEAAIAPDERCEIVAVEGNVMIVKAL